MHQTREAWLQSAAAMLRAYVFVTEAEMFVVPRFTVSASWPAWVRSYSDAMAATVSEQQSDTGFPHVVIRDDVDSPKDALHYLTHEMIHVMDNGASGHRGQFAHVFNTIGMVGRKTRSDASPHLENTLTVIAEKLGTYPKRYLEV